MWWRLRINLDCCCGAGRFLLGFGGEGFEVAWVLLINVAHSRRGRSGEDLEHGSSAAIIQYDTVQ